MIIAPLRGATESGLQNLKMLSWGMTHSSPILFIPYARWRRMRALALSRPSAFRQRILDPTFPLGKIHDAFSFFV